MNETLKFDLIAMKKDIKEEKKKTYLITSLSSTNSTSWGVFLRLRSASSWIWNPREWEKKRKQWLINHSTSQNIYQVNKKSDFNIQTNSNNLKIMNDICSSSIFTFMIWEIKPRTRWGCNTNNQQKCDKDYKLGT